MVTEHLETGASGFGRMLPCRPPLLRMTRTRWSRSPQCELEQRDPCSRRPPGWGYGAAWPADRVGTAWRGAGDQRRRRDADAPDLRWRPVPWTPRCAGTLRRPCASLCETAAGQSLELALLERRWLGRDTIFVLRSENWPLLLPCPSRRLPCARASMPRGRAIGDATWRWERSFRFATTSSTSLVTRAWPVRE